MNSPNGGTGSNAAANTSASTNNDDAAAPGATFEPSPSVTATSLDASSDAMAANEEEPRGCDFVPPPTAAAAAAGVSGLEIIDDENGPPPSAAMLAEMFYGEPADLAAMRTAAPEIVRDCPGLDPPLAMMEFPESKNMEAVVQRPPRPSNAALAELEDEVGAFEKARPTPLLMKLSVEGPPLPFDATELEVDEDTMKELEPPQQQIVQLVHEEDSVVIPTFEDEVVRVYTNRMGGRSTSPEYNAAMIDTVMTDTVNVDTSTPDGHRDEDEERNIQNPNRGNTSIGPDLEIGADSAFHVPEAVLVENEDMEVFVATHVDPPLPWWKQKQSKFFFALIFVLCIAAVIGFAVPRSSEGSMANSVVVVSVSTNAPSISTVPSSFPTLISSHVPSTTTSPSVKTTGSPSVSIKPTTSPSDKPSSVPSSPPSACVNKISSNAQKIDLPLDDPQDPLVAVDMKNMVVVVRDGPRNKGRPVYVIFYSLEADAGWKRVGDPNMLFCAGNQDDYSVALSGKTAFVGLALAEDEAGTVRVFEQNRFGGWVWAPGLTPDSNALHFGESVGIDGDLAFVSDQDMVYMFRRVDELTRTWVQFDRVDNHGRDHSISGDTIAIDNYFDDETIHLYKNTPDLDEVIRLQDPIPAGYIRSLDLSNNYLVYWNGDEGDAFIYRREGASLTFVFHQQINVSGNRIALDNDILIVGGIDSTHIFLEQNGNWEEAITLDQRADLRYESYALSDRQLLAVTSTEVHSFDIQDCAQEMPTQTPSSSQMPTPYPTRSSSPSLPPSLEPSKSSLPSQKPMAYPTTSNPSPPPSLKKSTSLSPSKSSPPPMAPASSISPSCITTTLAVDYDDEPGQTDFSLFFIVDDGDWEELINHYASSGDTSYSESLCLQEGSYMFTIYDGAVTNPDSVVGRDGICCDHGEGHYNMTSNGILIVEGGEFDSYERTYFDIPFVSGTNWTAQY